MKHQASQRGFGKISVELPFNTKNGALNIVEYGYNTWRAFFRFWAGRLRVLVLQPIYGVPLIFTAKNSLGIRVPHGAP